MGTTQALLTRSITINSPIRILWFGYERSSEEKIRDALTRAGVPSEVEFDIAMETYTTLDLHQWKQSVWRLIGMNALIAGVDAVFVADEGFPTAIDKEKFVESFSNQDMTKFVGLFVAERADERIDYVEVHLNLE